MAQIIKGDWMKLDAPIKKKKPAAKPASTEIYQLKISLKGSKPLIWRRVLVSADVTLDDLHFILQATMGWDGSHLHVFEVAKNTYGSRFPGEEIDDAEDEALVSLQQVAPAIKAKFKYEYDMGDSWLHDIVVEKILEPDAKLKTPSCAAGAGACPPEDCGGLWGYYSILDAIEDKKHPDHEEMQEWVGEDFDPDFFNIDEINKRLKPLQKK
jgi:hypothetical protein